MFAWLWALVAPWAGRALLKALPWAAALLPAVRAIAIGAALAGVLAAVVWLAWPDRTRMTAAEARQACEDTIARAELAATRDALRQAQQTLDLRARALDAAERWIDDITQEMEALRAAAPDPDAPVFAADDPWLRQRPR